MAYAPLDNPRIAIAVVVENAGYGATWAGPIAGYMMEKYINDTLTSNSKAEVEKFSKVDLIPAAIKHWYYVKDSLRLAKQKKAAEEAEINSVLPPATLDRNSDEQPRKISYDPEAEPNRKDSEDDKNQRTPNLQNTQAILPDNKKKNKQR